MTIDVHGGGNGAVTELVLHVAGTLMGHEHNGRIRVPKVMGIADPQACLFANPPGAELSVFGFPAGDATRKNPSAAGQCLRP